MKASATSDFSPPDSSDRRLVDLPAGRHLDLHAGLGLLLLVAARRRGVLGVGRLLAARCTGARALALHQPQAAAAAREQVLDDLLEVLRRRLEGLLEALADALVGLGDQALQLGERRLQVAALLLELLDVGDGLVVLLLGQRVDRAELLAPPGEALDARVERLALLVAAAARSAGSASSPSRPASVGQLALDLGGRVAHLLGGDLGAGHGLARVAQPALQLGLLVRAGAQRARRSRSPAGGVAVELARPARRGAPTTAACAPPAPTAARSASRRDRARRARCRRARARASRRARPARRRSARPAAAPRAGSAISSARRTAPGPSSGASRRRAITHSARLTASAASAASRAARRWRGVGVVAGGVGGRDRLGRLLGGAAGLGLLARRRARTRRPARRAGGAPRARAPPRPAGAWDSSPVAPSSQRGRRA